MSKEEEYIKHNAKKAQKLNNKYNIKGGIDKKYTFSLRFKPLINEFITHTQNEPSSNITATIIKTIKISVIFTILLLYLCQVPSTAS